MSRQLIRSAGVIGIATMASRVLGLVRDQVLAYFFGAGDAMDAFRIAFRLPNLLRDLFAEGAMSAALVPTFARAVARVGKDKAWELASKVINLLVIASGAIAVAGMVFAEPLVELYAGGFRDVPGKLELTVTLARIVFPFLPLVALAAVLMGMLNALHHFFVPALSPAMFNVATIATVIVLVPLSSSLGIEPIVVVAAATLLGGIGQVLLQWPVVSREGFRYRPILDAHDQWVGEIARLMVPGVAGLAAVQVNVFVNSWMASSLGTGAVSWLDYAFRLMYMPIGLFGVSIATAALPGIAGLAAGNDLTAVRHQVSTGLRAMAMLNIPATVGLVVLSTPIVELIFERGRFEAADTAATAAALAFYAPGLIGYSVVKLLSPVFYALGDSRAPVAASAFSVAFNILANLALVGPLGHVGLALGTAMAALVNAGLLMWWLRTRLCGLDGRRIVHAVSKVLLASVMMAVSVEYAHRVLIDLVSGPSVLFEAIQVCGAIAIGIVVLAGSSYALRIEEFRGLTRWLSAPRRTW